MQAVAAQFELLRRSGIVMVVSSIAGTEGVEVGFAVQVQVARRGDRLAVERPVGIEFEMRVDAADAVEFTGRGTLPIGVEGAHAGLAENVAAHPGNGEIGPDAGKLVVVGYGQAGAAIVGRHQAHGVRAVFPCEADSGRGIADAAREKQVQGCAEKIFILQKERAFFRKIDGIALVHCDLRVLGLDLAEVRIGGHVDDELIVDDELRVHAGLALATGLLKVRIGEVASVERAKAAHHTIRNQFNIVAGGNSFESIQGRGLAEAALAFQGNVGPEGIFSLAGDAAIQNDSPFLLLRPGKAQALEGNRHPHDEAAVGHFAARIPNRIE
jgi:hypothetical protein